MNTKVIYQDWPQSVKITTALTNRKLIIKSPTFPYVVGYLCLIVGVLGVAYALNNQDPGTQKHYIPDVCYIIVGLANILSGNSIKWIALNSSWEERLENKSSTGNKIMY